MEDLVTIARIVRPRGLKGEVVAEILTDFPDRFVGLIDVIGVRGNTREDLKIESHWFQKDRVILKFDGINSVESAERFRDWDVCVPAADVVELAEGEFYDWELEGCKVGTTDGKTLGTVRELMRTGGTELLVIHDGRRELLIPFAEAICVTVDVSNKVITVDPPEGLLDF